MSDPFSFLPMPLPLDILKYTEDLLTLHHILQASRGANIIFARYSHEVVEVIISRLTPDLQRMIRTIIHVRTDITKLHDLWRNNLNCGDFPGTNSCSFLAIFKEKFVNKTHSKIASRASEPLDKNTASRLAVWSSVATGAVLQHLTAVILDIFLERINNVQPQTLQDPGYQYKLKRYHHKIPPGCRYETPKFSSPSWIEEQRVLRALWHIQTFFDFVKIAKPKEGDHDRIWSFLKERKPRCMWENLKSFQCDEMDDVYKVLCESSSPLLTSFDEEHEPWAAPTMIIKSETLPRTLLHEDSNKDHARSLRLLEQQDCGHTTFTSLCSISASRLYQSDITRLRDLGLGIWDDDKLAKLGLIEDESLHLPRTFTIGADGRAPEG